MDLYRKLRRDDERSGEDHVQPSPAGHHITSRHITSRHVTTQHSHSTTNMHGGSSVWVDAVSTSTEAFVETALELAEKLDRMLAVAKERHTLHTVASPKAAFTRQNSPCARAPRRMSSLKRRRFGSSSPALTLPTNLAPRGATLTTGTQWYFPCHNSRNDDNNLASVSSADMEYSMGLLWRTPKPAPEPEPPLPASRIWPSSQRCVGDTRVHTYALVIGGLLSSGCDSFSSSTSTKTMVERHTRPRLPLAAGALTTWTATCVQMKASRRTTLYVRRVAQAYT